MRTRWVSALLVFLVALMPVLAAGAAKPRPLSGIGLLTIRSFTPPPDGENSALVLYNEPGMDRVAELAVTRLPGLGPVLKPLEGEYLATVTRQKGKWLRIIYDDADREGWLTPDRFWEYEPWPVYLKGRQARLLPGLKKGFYLLRSEPANTGAKLSQLSRENSLRIIQVEGNWAMVIVDLSQSGWLRWRDDDGRFLLAVDERFAPQKH